MAAVEAVASVDVMRHFLLCDAMKKHAGAADFLARLVKEKHLLEAESAEVIEEMVRKRDQNRHANYNKQVWNTQKVNLERCHVWERMGGRPWATGLVPEVMKKFEQFEPQDSRIWVMKDDIHVKSEALPIICFAWPDGYFFIDDGSHRAIALGFAGTMDVDAYVGRPIA